MAHIDGTGLRFVGSKSMGVEIHNADALEIIGDLGEFDYLITDPPYPTGGRSSHSDQSSVAQINEMLDSLSMSVMASVIRNVRKSKCFACWVMCDWRVVSFFSRMLRAGSLSTQSCIVWDKQQSAMSSLYHSQHELVLFATTPAFKDRLNNPFIGKNIVSVKGVRRNKTHAFEKPPELVEMMCKSFKPGRVIDPFCGTGGLLVGAQRLGWDVVGIDTMPAACKIAEERLGVDIPFEIR